MVENCLWAGRPAGQAPASNCMTVGSFDNQQNFGFKGNADKAESYGVELSAKYDISPNFDVKANYTWLESEITEGENQGNPIENTPRHALNFTGTWYVNDKFTTWLEAEYKSDRVRFTNPDRSMKNGKTLKKQLTNTRRS